MNKKTQSYLRRKDSRTHMCVCACVGVCVRGVWQARYAWDMCSLGQQIMWRLRQLQLQRALAQAQVLQVSSAVTVVSRGVA